MDMDRLSICLFGSHLFRYNNRPFHLGVRGTTLDLLRYLIVHRGREVRREYIAELLWAQSSERRQRSALNSAIWRIVKKLPDDPGISLHATGSNICFQVDDEVPVDTDILTQLVHAASGPAGVSPPLAQRLAAVLDASDAPFMNGLVEDWALSERERLFNIRLRGLTLLMHWYGDSRRYEDALEVGRRLVSADPFRETVQIDMMWLYVLNGQRAQALKQYQAYADLLRRELDIEPMTETRALYDHIRCDLNCGRQARDVAEPVVGDHATTRKRLDMMMVAIGRSRHEFFQALRTQTDSS